MAKQRVCPWWIGYLLASPLRRLLHDPARILAPFVRAGMTVLEPGPGMGFFTLELAGLVGPNGRVIAVDIQPRMLDGLKRRVSKAGLADRVDIRLAHTDSLGVGDFAGKVDFALAFAIVHEMPNALAFFTEVCQALKSGSCLLVAEPAGHVNTLQFEAELKTAAQAGLNLAGSPRIRWSRAALLRKD